MDTSGIETMASLQLEDELAALAAHISAGMCRWLELLGELDRRGVGAGGSPQAWLAWRCSLTPRSAREHLRVARALRELPLTRAVFGRGELSYAKVRALTRAATVETEAELIELAGELTAAQLERTIRAYRRVTTLEARELGDYEELSWHWDEDGALVVRGRLAPEDGALFIQAVEAARDRLRGAELERVRGSAEPHQESRRVTRIDALVAVADAALAHDTARNGGERHQVVVHIDEAALTGAGEGACLLAEGPAIAPETARRLACDASIVTIRGRPGKPLDLGRKTRAVSPALHRALRARDRGCRFPGCENHRHVDAHHIHHWASGGTTALDNLLLLCRRHHRLLHEGGYTIDHHGRFHYPYGTPIPTSPRPPGSHPDALQHHNRPLQTTPRTCKTGAGDPLDLDLAVHTLLQIDRAAAGTCPPGQETDPGG